MSVFGSIASDYDCHLGPLLFEPFAQDLGRRVDDITSGALLDIAAGTGITTRLLDSRLAPDVSIVATDISPEMLHVAQARCRSPRVVWRHADATALPFPGGSFNAAVCQFGLMFVPDKVAALREARRVLKTGGRYVFSVWDRIETCELSHITTRAVAALHSDAATNFVASGPHSYSNVARAYNDLRVAGFVDITVETIRLHSHAASAAAAANALCRGSPIRRDIEGFGIPLAQAIDAVARAIVDRFGEGPICAGMTAHVFTARS